jgi:hypothetical protein
MTHSGPRPDKSADRIRRVWTILAGMSALAATLVVKPWISLKQSLVRVEMLNEG